MTSTKTSEHLSKQELIAARGWIKDCTWENLYPEDVDELTDTDVTVGIARYFDGGIEAFKKAIAPSTKKCDRQGLK